jgi:hypothetical protein
MMISSLMRIEIQEALVKRASHPVWLHDEDIRNESSS